MNIHVRTYVCLYVGCVYTQYIGTCTVYTYLMYVSTFSIFHLSCVLPNVQAEEMQRRKVKAAGGPAKLGGM